MDVDSSMAFSRRHDLAALLKSRRASVQPDDVGIQRTVRRHVSGLRREEVASLAGISTTWYTWIEQGRPINISPEVLRQVGLALKFSENEIEFIQGLLRDEPRRCTLNPPVPDVLRALVESHVHAPAYIATPRLDLVVWNEFTKEIFGYHVDSAPLERNVLWRMFYDSSRRRLYPEWGSIARNATSTFRMLYTKYRGDEHFESLVEVMLQNNEFKAFWDRWDILVPSKTPPFQIDHEKLGRYEVTPIQATLDIAPDCYLALYSCVPKRD